MRTIEYYNIRSIGHPTVYLMCINKYIVYVFRAQYISYVFLYLQPANERKKSQETKTNKLFLLE